MARVHRLGQTKMSMSIPPGSGAAARRRSAGPDPNLAQKKLYLSEVVNRGDDQNQQQESMTASEVLSMVKFGAAAIFDSKNQAEPSDADLDAIVDRTRTETTSVGKRRPQQTPTRRISTPPREPSIQGTCLDLRVDASTIDGRRGLRPGPKRSQGCRTSGNANKGCSSSRARSV